MCVKPSTHDLAKMYIDVLLEEEEAGGRFVRSSAFALPARASSPGVSPEAVEPGPAGGDASREGIFVAPVEEDVDMPDAGPRTHLRTKLETDTPTRPTPRAASMPASAAPLAIVRGC